MIEKNAHDFDFRKRSLQFWKEIKESNIKNSIMNLSKNKVGYNVGVGTEKVLSDMLPNYLYRTATIYPEKTLREKTKLIFSGGGFTEFPFKTFTNNSFKDKLNKKNDLISIVPPTPKDIDNYKFYDQYFSRLMVVFGLSFLYDNLPEFLNSKETLINKNAEKK